MSRLFVFYIAEELRYFYRNCFIFNPQDSQYYQYAKELELRLDTFLKVTKNQANLFNPTQKTEFYQS